MIRGLQVLALGAAAARGGGGGPGGVASAAGGRGVPTVRAAGSWGRAIEVPGLAALDAGETSVVLGVSLGSVSCGAAGDCSAGGLYTDSRGLWQGFVVVEKNGRWGRAIEVPGLGALNKGAYPGNGAYVGYVSCRSAGNCAAGGDYLDRLKHAQGFVVSERRGRWGKAIEVPGLRELDTGAHAYLSSLSCASAGNCAAGGDYQDRHGHVQGFVVSERRGRWGKAIEVPGLGALNKPALRGEGAGVGSVSCASAGYCVAGGSYIERNFHSQGFVVSERRGRWGKAIEVPGLGALNTYGDAEVDSVACVPPGYCAVGGFYSRSGSGQQGFVASEHNGRWGKAINVPGLQALNTDGYADVGSVSCTSPGNCTAGGTYNNDPNLLGSNGYVVTEKNGRWGQASTIPGLAALNTNQEASVRSVSCGSPGNCAAGGSYYTEAHGQGVSAGFVAVQTNGIWHTAIEVPGLAALNTGGEGWVASVSCPPAGNCAAGGGYRDSHESQAFVTK